MAERYALRRWIEKHISVCKPNEIRSILDNLKAVDAAKELEMPVSQDEIMSIINNDILRG